MRALAADCLTVVANVGDDEEFYGLLVCPDIDTILYTLSNRIDRTRGWGVTDDTVKALSVLEDLGAPTWMRLGDADFGLHIWRTWRISQGATLGEVTCDATERFSIQAKVVPATGSPCRTKIRTDKGLLNFQEWFVGARCQPAVRGVEYVGVENAVASPEALDAIAKADVVVFAPSNPLLSLEPILAIEAVTEAIRATRAPRIGLSPLVNGKAFKGPLEKMLSDLAQEGGAGGIAKRYNGLLDGFVIDFSDAGEASAVQAVGMAPHMADIKMRDASDAERLARQMLSFAEGLSRRDTR